MKTQARPIVILATILAMASAYLSGTVVSAHRSPTGRTAPALTRAQWAAVDAANQLLMDGDVDMPVYLPLLSRN